MALYDLGYEEVEGWLVGLGEPRFRAGQVWAWLYRRLATDFEPMTDLPRALRARLAGLATVGALELLAEQISEEGEARKVLLGLRDGHTVETVLMLYPTPEDEDGGRRTVCISTQVGCGIGCAFCATGQSGLARSLSAGEIVAQVLHFDRTLRAQAGPERQISHVVLMGMGEPLANYDATWKALRILTDERGYHLGARRITLSTVGLAPGIRRMTEEPLQVNLAVSLHAATDALRDELVPVNRRYPLADLMAAVREYVERTHRRVSFEYALIAGVNDAPDQARQVAALLRGLLCHVNLIPLNPTPGSAPGPLGLSARDRPNGVAGAGWQGSSRETVEAFRAGLEQAGVPVTVRLRRGVEIQAGCGQLRRRSARG